MTSLPLIPGVRFEVPGCRLPMGDAAIDAVHVCFCGEQHRPRMHAGRHAAAACEHGHDCYANAVCTTCGAQWVCTGAAAACDHAPSRGGTLPAPPGAGGRPGGSP